MATTQYSPTFTNRVGFSTNPSASRGWYNDIDNGIMTMTAIFEGMTPNLLSSNSFSTEFPVSVDSTFVSFKGKATLTGDVLGGAIGKITTSRNPTTGILTLNIAFPILGALSGFTTSDVHVDFSVKAF